MKSLRLIAPSPARHDLRRLALLAGLLLFTPGLSRASADESVPPQNPEAKPFATVDLRLGAFALSDINTHLQLDSSLGTAGSNLNLADRLGANTSLSVFRADANWNISGPHGIEASWYDITLKGAKVIDTSIAWGDQVYPVTSRIETRFGTNVYKLAYAYVFHHDSRHEFTGLIGLHIMQFKASLEATNLALIQRFSITAPLPSFGLAWRAEWTERFSTRASIQYFGISLDDGKYSGHFTDALVTAEYRLSDTYGLGAGYNRFDLSGAFKPNALKLSMDYAYNGLLFYAFARF